MEGGREGGESGKKGEVGVYQWAKRKYVSFLTHFCQVTVIRFGNGPILINAKLKGYRRKLFCKIF